MSNDVVLVVLSKNSLSSDRVEWELASAREKERAEGRDVICPITIDTYWEEWTEDPVLKPEVLKYRVVPFENWTNDFFTANIRNPHTRRAYYNAACKFTEFHMKPAVLNARRVLSIWSA